MARIPDFVCKAKKKNEVARCIKGEWVLHKRTSTYNQETKKSETVYIAVAIATENGRIPYQQNKAVVTPIQRYEFGLSYALQTLMPKHWMVSLKKDASPIFLDMIQKISPSSYLLRNKTIVLPKGRNAELQQKNFIRKIGGEEILEQLKALMDIQLIIIGDEMRIQSPTEEHQKILDAFSIQLEVSVSI